jgi:NAD+ kinase
LKSPKPITRVGLLANPEKPACREAVRRAAREIAAAGRDYFCDPATAALAGLRSAPRLGLRALGREVDLLLVFGGDGTILRVARAVAGRPTPVLGINVGGLGFLTAASSEHVAGALASVWAGDFQVESRTLIEAQRVARGRTVRQVALNDFVISRSTVTRLIELEVSVDGAVLTRYRCDGLIVSSPTGSTAYSLAAGGAIVTPNAEVFALTPICPHTLSNRSVIVSLRSVVRVKVLSPRIAILLSADGQQQTRLAPTHTVTIRSSDRVIRLVRLAGSSFFETLRQKLNWSGSTV